MSDLIIITECDIRQLLEVNKIKPKAVYLDIEKFIPKIPYLEDCHIVLLVRGMCKVSIPRLVDLYTRLEKQNESNANCILSLSVITDIDITDFRDFYKYTGFNLRSLSKVHKRKVTNRGIDLFYNLKYINAENCSYFESKKEELEREIEILKEIKPSAEYLKINEIIERL